MSATAPPPNSSVADPDAAPDRVELIGTKLADTIVLVSDATALLKKGYAATHTRQELYALVWSEPVRDLTSDQRSAGACARGAEVIRSRHGTHDEQTAGEARFNNLPVI